MALSIAPVVAIYPMLNVSVVAILNISLRNNLFEASPIRSLIQERGHSSCLWMLQDNTPRVKGLLSILLSIPAIFVVIFERDIYNNIIIIGGFFGALILMVIPVTLVSAAREMDSEYNPKENFNASPF